MSLLAPCPSCRRHVRVVESACPFCSAAIDPQRIAPRAMPTQRLGRAAVAAFGALVVTAAPGCGTSTTPPDAYHDDAFYGLGGDVYGAPPHDAWVDDAGHDGGLAGAYGGPPVDAGMDAAGDAEVDTGTHALYGAPPVPSPPPEQP